MKYKHLGFLYGLLILGVISACAMAISAILTPFLSPLIVGILLGAALSPLYPRLEKAYDIQSGITFGAKKLLRAGIVCYGSYITLGEIATLGLNGLLVSLIVVSVVFVCAIVIGRMLKLDNEIAMLVGIGSECVEQQQSLP